MLVREPASLYILTRVYDTRISIEIHTHRSINLHASVYKCLANPGRVPALLAGAMAEFERLLPQDCIRTSMYDKCSDLTKMTTPLDHMSHSKDKSGKK